MLETLKNISLFMVSITIISISLVILWSIISVILDNIAKKLVIKKLEKLEKYFNKLNIEENKQEK